MWNAIKDNWLAYLLILFCAVLPWSLAGMQIAAVMVIIGAILHGIIYKHSPVKFHPFYLFILFYLLTQILASLFSKAPAKSLISVFNTDWFILAVPFFASLPIKEKLRLRAFQVLIGSAGLIGIYGIFQFFFGWDFYRGHSIAQMGEFFRANGGYNFYLTYAGNQLLVLALAFSFFILSRTEKSIKWFYLISLALIFFSVIATFGRSTWIAMFFILLLGSWVLNRRLFLVFAGILIVFGGILTAISPEIRMRLISIFDPAQNEARLNIWRTAWEMFKDHSVVGIGSGFFNDYFPQYKVPGFYDASGHAHNDFLNVAVNSGVIGLIGWLTMWFGWFFYTLKIFKLKLLTVTDNRIIFGSLLAVAGILVAAVFQCYYTDLENNILWWFIAASSLHIAISDRELKKNNTGFSLN